MQKTVSLITTLYLKTSLSSTHFQKMAGRYYQAAPRLGRGRGSPTTRAQPGTESSRPGPTSRYNSQGLLEFPPWDDWTTSETYQQYLARLERPDQLFQKFFNNALNAMTTLATSGWMKDQAVFLLQLFLTTIEDPEKRKMCNEFLLDYLSLFNKFIFNHRELFDQSLQLAKGQLTRVNQDQLDKFRCWKDEMKKLEEEKEILYASLTRLEVEKEMKQLALDKEELKMRHRTFAEIAQARIHEEEADEPTLPIDVRMATRAVYIAYDRAQAAEKGILKGALMNYNVPYMPSEKEKKDMQEYGAAHNWPEMYIDNDHLRFPQEEVRRLRLMKGIKEMVPGIPDLQEDNAKLERNKVKEAKRQAARKETAPLLYPTTETRGRGGKAPEEMGARRKPETVAQRLDKNPRPVSLWDEAMEAREKARQAEAAADKALMEAQERNLRRVLDEEEEDESNNPPSTSLTEGSLSCWGKWEPKESYAQALVPKIPEIQPKVELNIPNFEVIRGGIYKDGRCVRRTITLAVDDEDNALSAVATSTPTPSPTSSPAKSTKEDRLGDNPPRELWTRGRKTGRKD